MSEPSRERPGQTPPPPPKGEDGERQAGAAGRRRRRRHRERGSEEDERRQRSPVLIIIGWIVMLVVVSAVFIWPTQYLREYVEGVVTIPRPLLGILVPVAWLIVVMFVFRIVARFSYRQYLRRRSPYMPNPVQEAMDALDRIAEGDFDVLLEVDEGYFGQFNELATKINDLARGLGATEKMRQDFVSNVSHEIQSPLTSIGGFATLLKDENLDPETRRHYLEIIEAETARLSKLSENLLRLSALDSETQPLHRRQYRLDRQVESAILLLAPQWNDKDLEMEVDLDQVELTGDEDLLSQVWINLIHNSIKFTPQGGKLSIALAEREGRCVFTLTDTGIGMSRETVERVFERFYKADAARMREKGGNGLGLSIVQKIVRLHDGEIHVDSEEGVGSVFTVTLPIGA